MNRRLVASVTGTLLFLAGCSGTGGIPKAHRDPKPGSPSPAASPATVAPLRQQTVWLCRPGTAPDPCTSSRAATEVLADGSRRSLPVIPARQPVDCFYAYPTVSGEKSDNSDLRIHPEEVQTAIEQASRFSQICRVWAPMYRQRTVADLFRIADSLPQSKPNVTAFASLLAAWRDYLAHDNHGRPIVVIGHSQGSAMLVRLLREEVDPDPALRRRLLLAILPGANVATRTGSSEGGSFQHLPLCTARGETRCVIAYSTFPGPPPPGALFGRPGAGVSYLTGDLTSADRTVACVNPADPGSDAKHFVHPLEQAIQTPSVSVTTPWVEFPHQVTAQCRSAAGASFLQIDTTRGSPAAAITKESLGPAWGYHQSDVNLALGDLVDDVAAAEHSQRQ